VTGRGKKRTKMREEMNVEVSSPNTDLYLHTHSHTTTTTIIILLVPLIFKLWLFSVQLINCLEQTLDKLQLKAKLGTNYCEGATWTFHPFICN